MSSDRPSEQVSDGEDPPPPPSGPPPASQGASTGGWRSPSSPPSAAKAPRHSAVARDDSASSSQADAAPPTGGAAAAPPAPAPAPAAAHARALARAPAPAPAAVTAGVKEESRGLATATTALAVGPAAPLPRPPRRLSATQEAELRAAILEGFVRNAISLSRLIARTPPALAALPPPPPPAARPVGAGGHSRSADALSPVAPQPTALQQLPLGRPPPPPPAAEVAVAAAEGLRGHRSDVEGRASLRSLLAVRSSWRSAASLSLSLWGDEALLPPPLSRRRPTVATCAAAARPHLCAEPVGRRCSSWGALWGPGAGSPPPSPSPSAASQGSIPLRRCKSLTDLTTRASEDNPD